MSAKSEKFATVVDPDKIAAVRTIAKDEGRQLRALVDEALSDLIEKRKHSQPRAHVLAAHTASIKQHGPVYKKLAE